MSKAQPDTELFRIMNMDVQLYDEVFDIADEKFHILISMRVRILEYKKFSESYFLLKYVFRNLNIRNEYVDNIKYLQMISSIKWTDLLKLESMQNKFYYCTPDYLNDDDPNAICKMDLSKNFKLVYEENQVKIDDEVLNYFYVRVNIAKDIYALIKNHIKSIEPSKKYKDDDTNLCQISICENNGECQVVEFYEYIIMYCECPHGFFGSLCEHVNRCPYCENNECNVDGTCAKCRPGWTGVYCDDRSVSEIIPCNGNGEFELVNNHRTCICYPNYIGRYCSISCFSERICPDGQYCLIQHGRVICSKVKPTTTTKLPPLPDPNGKGPVKPSLVRPPTIVDPIAPTNPGIPTDPLIRPDPSLPTNPSIKKPYRPDSTRTSQYASIYALNRIRTTGFVLGGITCFLLLGCPMNAAIFNGL